MTELKIHNLSAKLGDKKILKDISFTLKSGELLTVLGINGAGKTTLLKAIAGLIDYSGEITLDTYRLNSLSRLARAQQIAFLPQIAEIQADISGGDLISMGRYPFSRGVLTARDRKIIDQAISLTKCTEYISLNIKSLSGGERQRLLLASAIAQEPKVLLLDEPLNFMDPGFENEYQQIVKELCRQSGIIIIQVSHNLNASLAISDYILTIQDKSLQYFGEPKKWLESKGAQNLYGVNFTLVRNPQTNFPVIING